MQPRCQCDLLSHPVTDADPKQLCATGTVGIAAVGLALGCQKPTNDHRPVSGKRKAPSRYTLDLQRSTPMASSTTTSTMAQPSSAPTARLRKRNSFGRPLSSSSRLSLGNLTARSIPDIQAVRESAVSEQRGTQNTRPSFSHEPFDFEFNGNNTTSRSSWLRRKSTLSISKDETPVSTPPPGSPSVSFSNGSTAPILPSSTFLGSSTSSRNKLVKRSTSQRALQGNNVMHSSLRRPATSHQRSATLQQQYLSEDDRSSQNNSLFHPPSPLHDLREDQQIDDESSHKWQSFFRPQAIKLAKDGSSKKRNAADGVSRADTLKAIVPETHKPATLMLAKSIVPHSPDDTFNARLPQRTHSSRLSTPIGFDTRIPLSTGHVQTEIYADPEPTPRKSFSFGGLFSSPSPSTWKKPRSGSLRKHKDPRESSGSRRVASAPQSMGTPNISSHDPNESISRGYPKTRRSGTGYRNFFSGERDTSSSESRVPSSPLPPLNRLSAFEIDLPGTAPSYPTTPHIDQAPASRLFTPPSPASSSPLGPLPFNTVRNKAHRPSGAPSDHASTLLGSDNDTSRILSGDEDDGRSETVYDSTRTGATGSSHSGVRRPPIDMVFDGSPPSEISKHKLLALQDLMSHDSFQEPPIQRADILEEDEIPSTPIRHAASCKEDIRPTPIHTISHSEVQPVNLLPPPEPYHNAESNNHYAPDNNRTADNEVWTFDDTDSLNLSAKAVSSSVIADDSSGNPHDPTEGAFLSPSSDYGPSNEANGSKPSIFDWSEPPSSEKESFGGSSPRPKTVHGPNGKETRGSRSNGRHGPSPLHLRSQSVPVPSDGSGHRTNGNTAKLESWVLNKGVSEDWDNDFEFDESPRPTKQTSVSHEYTRSSSSAGMLVPRSILERQASVHGQFGHVKELTLLVEELKRLQQQATVQGIMDGPSAELWKEAEGIINLATVDDDDQEFPPPRSPRSPSFDFDAFDEDSPVSQARRKSGISSSRGDRSSGAETISSPHTPNQTPSRSSPEKSNLETPPPQTSRPRKESAAKAKSVLENIHQQRSRHELVMLEQSSQKKLPFDTTSLRDLVIRAGVVTRALKEIVRRADNAAITPQATPSTPPDPPFSQIFQQPPSSPSVKKSPRVTHSPKSDSFIGGGIASNDNDISGHLKMMTVV